MRYLAHRGSQMSCLNHLCQTLKIKRKKWNKDSLHYIYTWSKNSTSEWVKNRIRKERQLMTPISWINHLILWQRTGFCSCRRTVTLFRIYLNLFVRRHVRHRIASARFLMAPTGRASYRIGAAFPIGTRLTTGRCCLI